MGKVLFIVAWLLIGLAAVATEEDEMEELAYAENYKFLLDLIDEYDYNGQGAIRKDQYGEFLYKVITKGSEQEKVVVTQLSALRGAVDTFADEKQAEDVGTNCCKVGVQNFYDDLTNGFYDFLANRTEYR